MNKIDNPLLHKAIDMAKKSTMAFRHGAILFSKKRVYSSGYNRSDRSRLNGMDFPSIHAEMDSITCSISPLKRKHYLKGPCERNKI